jgi:hypothetical protein
MIEDLKNISELVEKHGNWKQKKSFNKVINHCDFLDENFKDKSVYLERFCAWYIAFRLEMNNEKWEEVGDFEVKNFLLNPLNIILKSPIENSLLRIENEVQLIEMNNGRPFLKNTDISKTFSLIIRDFVAKQTKDNYARTKDK